MRASSRTSQQALVALNQAALAIAAEVSLDKVLQQITDSARELVGARYAALGVPEADRQLGRFIVSGMTPAQIELLPHHPRGMGLLGAIIREGRSIRIPQISRDPRSVGFPLHHPPMFSFLGVPIMSAGKILGNLYLTDKVTTSLEDGRELIVEFSAADQELVEMFAVHAAIAIQNAQLYDQVGRLAIVEERSRIGMDLHDGVIQSIYAVGLTLESARLLLPGDPEAANEMLVKVITNLNDVIRDIRNFILDLRPQRFTGDLKQALARLVREFQANAMIPVNLTAPPKVLVGLPTPISRTIFLTTQEALANVARHARAKQVTVELQRQGRDVILSIEDDGLGFKLEEQDQAVGHGLPNMRARAEECNGIFTIQTAPGAGTQLRLQLPVNSYR
jgi:signal transduction histidine kinase